MTDPVNGGAAVVEALAAHGVRDVFGIPGTHNLELYRHLPAAGIRHVVTRHEQGAGYAADGYARVSGRPGVFITTSGPGITNAVTALATSYADSVPTLAISPGVPRGKVGADFGWLHEVKAQQAALDAVCAASVRVERADDIPETVASLFERLATGRPRPLHLEIPVDVLEEHWTRRPPVVRTPADAPRPAAAATRALGAALGAAQRPLVIAGGGARAAAAQLAELAGLGVPVLTTVNGKGVLDESHPFSLGAGIRLQAAQRACDAADLVLVVGSELGDSDLWGGRIAPGVEGVRVIARVDVDPGQLHKNVPADIPVAGDAARVLSDLLDLLRTSGADGRWRATWTEQLPGIRAAITAEADRDAGPWAEIQQVLRDALPADVVVAGDSSQVTYYGTVHYWPFGPANRLLYPTGYATLGYGLPAAIGAMTADPRRPVVALVGDGAAMFSIQELLTATEQRLPLPVVVVDNGGYGEIREQMLDRGIAPLGVDLHTPDFAALARSVGARGVTATDVADLGSLAADALQAEGPTLIHYRVDGRAVSPNS
jgi:thiamine pyrophosphate-dependent acetolactate synthase large subunit-like protein